MTLVQSLDVPKLFAVCCHVLQCHVIAVSLALSQMVAHWVCCHWHHPALLLDSWDNERHRTDGWAFEFVHIVLLFICLWCLGKKEKWNLGQTCTIIILLIISTFQKLLPTWLWASVSLKLNLKFAFAEKSVSISVCFDLCAYLAKLTSFNFPSGIQTQQQDGYVLCGQKVLYQCS